MYRFCHYDAVLPVILVIFTGDGSLRLNGGEESARKGISSASVVPRMEKNLSCRPRFAPGNHAGGKNKQLKAEKAFSHLSFIGSNTDTGYLRKIEEHAPCAADRRQ